MVSAEIVFLSADKIGNSEAYLASLSRWSKIFPEKYQKHAFTAFLLSSPLLYRGSQQAMVLCSSWHIVVMAWNGPQDLLSPRKSGCFVGMTVEKGSM